MPTWQEVVEQDYRAWDRPRLVIDTDRQTVDGVSRVAYSDADVAGRRYAIELMRAAGLAPRIDPVGNICAQGADVLRRCVTVPAIERRVCRHL